jgi:hypothetical protein
VLYHEVSRSIRLEATMNDHNQSRAVHLQSSAIVMAAVITTIGAITAAIIQSGWLGKSPAASLSPAVMEETVVQPSTFHQPAARQSLGPSTVAESALARPTFSPQVVRQTALMPVSTQLPATKSPASFVGTIEPVSDSTQPAMPPANLRPQSPHADNFLTGASALTPTAVLTSYASSPQATTSAANTPAALSVGPTSRTMASPWYYFGAPNPPDKQSDSAKTASKSWNWNAFTRVFQGHN